MLKREPLIFGASLASVVGVALVIEATGGLPSQLAHLYYIPVVVAALLLPLRLSLVVAALAGLAVSPLPDVIHRPLGIDVYYESPAPWNLSSNGWIIRPVAFATISFLASRLTRERFEKSAAIATSVTRGDELTLLGRIDTMILNGATEQQSLAEIARMVAAFTKAKAAGIAVPGESRTSVHAIYVRDDDLSTVIEEDLPFGVGVSGWVLLHGEPAFAPDIHSDPRYGQMVAFADRVGYRSAASVPIILEGDVLGALTVGYETRRDFPPEEVTTLERLSKQVAIAVANARQRKALRELAQETAIALAGAIEARDPYTCEHCSRLATYAAVTAAALGLQGNEIEVVRLGAALHDVGKVLVPDEILKKSAKLTPDEYAIIKQHCYQGGQICKRVSFLEAAYPIVYHHHERWDGRGYPDSIAGDRIPLGARIVSVADAYDAMTSDRPYRQALPDEEARAILLEGAGSQWEALIVERFLAGHPAPAQHRAKAA